MKKYIIVLFIILPLSSYSQVGLEKYIALSNILILDSIPIGTKVGTFQVSHSNLAEYFYSLVPGEGDTDNGSFIINGSDLLTNTTFNAYLKSECKIRVQAINNDGEIITTIKTLLVKKYSECMRWEKTSIETTSYAINKGDSVNLFFKHYPLTFNPHPYTEWIHTMELGIACAIWSTGDTSGLVTVHPEVTTTYWADITSCFITIQSEVTKTYKADELEGMASTNCRKYITITVKNPSIPDNIPQHGLVAYYPFNGNANDESGNNNHGTVNGAALTTDRMGNVNRAYSFDGINDDINLGVNPAINSILNDFSVSYWIYKPTQGNGGVIASYSSQGGSSWRMNFTIKGDSIASGFLALIDGINGLWKSNYSPDNTVQINTWYNIMVVRNGDILKTYVNSILVSESKVTSAPLHNPTSPPATTKIGVIFPNIPYNTPEWFQGKIDDICIYNRALDEQEIKSLYLEGGKKIYFDNIKAKIGDVVEIGIKTTDLFLNDEIISYQFDFNYDPAKLQYIGHSLTGTIANGGGIAVNSSTTGLLRISYMNQASIIGAGEILKLSFKILKLETTTPTITDFLYNAQKVTFISNGTITAITRYGDIDANEQVQAFDAALALKYSVGFDPLPSVDPLPWESWRVIIGNVDGVGEIAAYDAALILQYSTGIITMFPVEGVKNSKINNADIKVSINNNELYFSATGDLLGLNVNCPSCIGVLGQPVILNSNFLSAINITENVYKIGLATTSPPNENDPFMKIPILKKDTITLEMTVNNVVKALTINLATTETIDMDDSKIMIYPNPVRSSLKIVTPYEKSASEIFSIDGKLMKSFQMNSFSNEINIEDLPRGLYILKIRNETDVIINKFIKE